MKAMHANMYERIYYREKLKQCAGARKQLDTFTGGWFLTAKIRYRKY